MKRVLLFSVLLGGGLVGSQLLPAVPGGADPIVGTSIRIATMLCLAYIMIHVGWEFELDRARARSLAADYGIAATTAAEDRRRPHDGQPGRSHPARRRE